MPKERQTCTECSMRRQKCDRNIPCSRCVKRGEPEKCTREWPREGYDPKKHRIYPRPDKDDHASPTSDADKGVDLSSPGSAAVQQDESSVHPSLRASASVSVPSIRSGLNRPSQVTSAHPRPRDPNFDSEKEASVLDFVTWGRSDLADYQVKSFDLLREPFKNNARPAVVEQEYSNGFGNTNAQQISFLQLLLPRRAQVLQLVDYHINKVLWYHACFHGDTFRKELQTQYLNPEGLQVRDADLRWTALLFAILSASMVCAHDSIASSWGFQRSERYRLTRQWYKASLTCLNLADYMWRHHLLSVQTICVLTMSGHILGFSNTQSTLHGAALKIAQGLGLQRLGPEADEGALQERDLTPARREKIIRREIGRRVWGQVCNQDWFSIPFSEMYSIQKSQYSTMRPQHIDDRTLLPVPTHEPGSTSFSRVIHDIAGIMPQAHDALCSASTMYTKYEQVIHYDAKLKALATEGMPSFFHTREPVSSSWPEWLPWARKGIRLCIAHKTIMIHRSFLGKSLTDPTFEPTRKTCMEAAKTILREARQANNASDEPMLWIDQAFMVAAGITMSLDIFHRKTTEPEYAEHRKYVENAIAMLSKYEHSMIAIRGVRLLTSLLAEEARLSAEKSMNNYKKKRTHEDEPEMSPDSTANTPSFAQVSNGSFSNAMKRQKFDVPKFLESFVGSDNNLSQSLRSSSRADSTPLPGGPNDFMPSTLNNNGDMVLGNGRLGNVLMQQQGASETSPPTDPVIPNSQNAVQSASGILGLPVDYGYEAFEQIFPPHAGISNSFLFEDLLNFEL